MGIFEQLVGDSHCLVFGDEGFETIRLSNLLAAVNRDSAKASRLLSRFLRLLRQFSCTTISVAFRERVFSAAERPLDTRRVLSSYFLEEWHDLLSPELREALAQQEDAEAVDDVAFTAVQAPIAKPFTLLADLVPQILGMVCLVMVTDRVVCSDAADYTSLPEIWPDPVAIGSTPVGKKKWNFIRSAPTNYNSHQAVARGYRLSRSMSTLVEDKFYDEPLELTLTPDRHPVAMMELPHASSARAEYCEPYIVVYDVSVSIKGVSWRADAWFSIRRVASSFRWFAQVVVG